MLAPLRPTALLRRCVDGWPCVIGDFRGRRMRKGSKIQQYLENHENCNFYYRALDRTTSRLCTICIVAPRAHTKSDSLSSRRRIADADATTARRALPRCACDDDACQGQQLSV